MEKRDKFLKPAPAPPDEADRWVQASVFPKLPVPEVRVLKGEEAWRAWDLAVKLYDKGPPR